MKRFFSIILILSAFVVQAKDLSKAIVDNDVVFEELDGAVAVEAEHFYKQTNNTLRQWYITSKQGLPAVGNDPDDPHIVGASNNAYLEILPDTRWTHAEKLIAGENFSNTPGELAVLHYKIYFNTPGKYYVWARAFSTGSEDNGMHVGLDGEWPESGARLQWCQGKQTWKWESRQRTEKVHCGEPYKLFIEIDKAGMHEVMFSMREDGFEFDKFILTQEKDPNLGEGVGMASKLRSGQLPPAFPLVTVNPKNAMEKNYAVQVKNAIPNAQVLKAVDFPVLDAGFYKDKTWLAIDPNKHKEASTSMRFPFSDGVYDVVFLSVGENDGKSSYKVWINDKQIGEFITPLSNDMFYEGPKHNDLWENININKGDVIKVEARVGTDGQEFSRGRWSGIVFAPMTKGKDALAVNYQKEVAKAKKAAKKIVEPSLPFSDITKRLKDGDASVEISGELKQWHKVTLTLDGPFAHELDEKVNPFTDYNMMVTFTHASGKPSYTVPGYFAADGNAANTSSDAGTKWRAHLSPDKKGKWTYRISFKKGENAAQNFNGSDLTKYSNITGEFKIAKSDKTGRDFRAKGRLEYVGKHHLQFMGSKDYFIKAGADAPETLLAYEDFDATYTVKPNVPVKKYNAHKQDYKSTYPTWKDGKGKGLTGAIGYLSDKGANAFSFLTYNAGGDGDNVWPFVSRNEKFHYDCSKLDQWGLVFDFAQEKGMYLHFKTQETENDDDRKGHKTFAAGDKPESLDGGKLGLERKLYYRELVARYGYLLALNWNMGEENTQSTEERQDMIKFISDIDAFNHNVVLHTFPNEQEKVYKPLLGNKSALTGVSLQNHWNKVFHFTLMWLNESEKAGRPWVVANDEQGSASEGAVPDNGYKGFDGANSGYDLHDVRKQTLYGNLMAGGAGVEYYFGYKLPENDLICEDWRSRDESWEYCKIAIDFFSEHVPFYEMENADALIGNTTEDKGKHCLAIPNKFYLVYLAYDKTTSIDLSDAKCKFKVKWFNPRTGKFFTTGINKVKGGSVVELGNPPVNDGEDWMVILEK